MTGIVYGESTGGWRIPCEKSVHVMISLHSITFSHIPHPTLIDAHEL